MKKHIYLFVILLIFNSITFKALASDETYHNTISISLNNYAMADDSISNSNNYYAIKKDNSLQVWNKDEKNKNQNAKIILNDIQSIQNGYAIGKDGELWECNKGIFSKWDKEEPVKVAENIKSVAAGSSNVFYIKNDDTLWGTGANDEGQMAINGTEEYYYEPVRIMYNVKKIAAGYNHTIILKNDGSVWGAGNNDYGQLGTDIKTLYSSAKPIKIMDGIKDIFAGETSTFMLDDNNNLYYCGNLFGLTVSEENNCSTPIICAKNVKSVSPHWGYSLILKQDNTLWMQCITETDERGYTLSNECGIDFNDMPKKIMDDVNSISEWCTEGDNTSLILTNKGELYEFNLIGDKKTHTGIIDIIKIDDNIKLKIDEIINSKYYKDISSQTENEQNAIKHLAKAGIIEGTSETEFSPDKPITRAEIAALLLRMTAKNDKEGNGGFDDVTSEKWYYDTAGASRKYDIVSGFEDNTFRGDDTISKVQLISLAARVMRNESSFANELREIKHYQDIPEWAEEDTSLAVQEGLVEESALLNPNNGVSRAEAAVILYNLYNRV